MPSERPHCAFTILASKHNETPGREAGQAAEPFAYFRT